MINPIIISLVLTQPLAQPPKDPIKEPYTFKSVFTQEDLIKQQNDKLLKIMFKEMVKDANSKKRK